AAAHAARAAVARTPFQLPELARAGVPDAGGVGLAVLLDALVEALGGQPARGEITGIRGLGPPAVAHPAGSERFAYEVQYLLEAHPSAMEQVRHTLCGLGDCVAVVGGSTAPGRLPTWNVHAHVNDVGAAIEAGARAGQPYRMSVTRLAGPASPRGGEPGSSVMAVCDGDGLSALLAAEGASVVVPDHGRLTAQRLHEAIMASGARQVVVLDPAAHPDALAAASTLAGASGVSVTIIPIRSPVQALAALAVRDERRTFEDDVAAMAEAAGACRHAAVTWAGDRAFTVVGRCLRGDVLALVDGEVNLIGRDVLDAGRALLDRLLVGGGELVTLVTGESSPPGLSESLTAHLRQRWPLVEVRCYVGGQPDSPLLIGVE
ncbi:MAG: DAK2 domain-containing protein, partial [Dactylosporangium sp.]|nr:DAK2 domain-containing protein [Dactylosporangium sp.]NNJ60071.1 DAK2 domain-containing protein [Dactylosporangium sp.]